MPTVQLAVVDALANKLKERRETIALSESSAGGLISAMLLSVPGASRYFLGSAVVYTHASRQALLGIEDEQVRGIRSASEPYAVLCARTIRQRLGATWSLAETGAAGPTGNRYGDASGHVCIAVDGPITAQMTLETDDTNRERNMWFFAKAALELLHEQMQKAN